MSREDTCVDYPQLFDCLGNPLGVPGPKSILRGDGTYRVGTDIAPGTYVSAGPSTPGSSCYGFRHQNLSSGAGDVID